LGKLGGSGEDNGALGALEGGGDTGGFAGGFGAVLAGWGGLVVVAVAAELAARVSGALVTSFVTGVEVVDVTAVVGVAAVGAILVAGLGGTRIAAGVEPTMEAICCVVTLASVTDGVLIAPVEPRCADVAVAAVCVLPVATAVGPFARVEEDCFVVLSDVLLAASALLAELLSVVDVLCAAVEVG